MKKFYVIILLISIYFGCTHEGLSGLDHELLKLVGNPEAFTLPDENDFASIPQSPANPLTKEKIELGKLLFFEPAFANEPLDSHLRNTYTCSSCHIPEAGFRPGRKQGIADGGYGFGFNGEGRIKYPTYHSDSVDAQGARPLAVLNTAFVENTMWNGSFGSEGLNIGTEDVWAQEAPGTYFNNLRIGALEGQNIDGLFTHRMLYTKEIIEEANYTDLFDAAFPDWSEEDRYSRKGASFALSAYLRHLMTNKAPFQDWLRGYFDAMSEQQKKGAILFFGKAGCVGCHYEKNLGSMRFEALGVNDLYENGGLNTHADDLRNFGRGGFTKRPEDMFKFRTPQLYNLGDSGPYFHGGSKETLEDVVRYFNEGVAENSRVPQEQLSYFMKPLGLTEDEIQDLTEFLRNGLRDPDLNRYVPTEVRSGLCFPNNDVLSKLQNNCQ